MGDFDDSFGDGVGERRDAVDDNKGVADEGGFDGGGAAGDDGGAGMEEGGAGIGDGIDGKAVGVILHEALNGGALGCVEGGSEGNEEVVRVAEKGRGGEHFGEVGLDFFHPAAGEKADPFSVGVRGVEVIFGGELLAGDGGLRQVGEGMADEFGIDAAGAVEGLLEGKDDEHAADEFPDEVDAVLLPGPELRADEVDDGNAEAVEFPGEAEVDVGEVDEDGEVGAAGRGWRA